MIDANQFILVEPDTSKLGWGVVKFVALLQVILFMHYSSNIYCLTFQLFIGFLLIIVHFTPKK